MILANAKLLKYLKSVFSDCYVNVTSVDVRHLNEHEHAAYDGKSILS